MTLKYCPHCKNEQDITGFSKDKSRSSGRSSWCRTCVSTYLRDKYKKNPRKVLDQNAEWRKENSLNKLQYELKHRYDLSLEQFEELRKQQKESCAICFISEKQLKSRLHVDHNHTSGTVRGLLCSPCNTALGLLKEDENIILSLLEYLRKSYITELADSTNEKVG